MEFTYDIGSTWQQNCERGPQFRVPAPPLVELPRRKFLGLSVRSRIGIAAGLLLNSRWIAGYAARGFDILTYKTVRSSARDCYPLPNWVFVDDESPNDHLQPVFVRDIPPECPTEVSSSVCFGMPSVAPDVWRDDISVAKSGLSSGQILIVSVVATPGTQPDRQAIAEDFARCAAWAVESGADVIEANLSCPNVCSAEGTIYQDAEFSQIVARRIRNEIGTTPLLLKTGLFDRLISMQEFIGSVAEFASGVTLVNCMIRPVLHRDHRPAFGPQFIRAGVLGRVIHQPSVAAVQELCDFIRREALALEVAAVGGVSCLADFEDFFNAGASAVLCGSSPMYLPNLAVEIQQLRPEW